MNVKRIALIFANIVALICSSACSTSATDTLGMQNGTLSPCPSSPNCVSSYASDKEHYITAICATGPVDEVMDKLVKCINHMERSTIVRREGPYLHAVFRSKIFRFVDDFECYYVPEKSRIEVRSAARMGYTDFSVNRKRVEKLRQDFIAQQDGQSQP